MKFGYFDDNAKEYVITSPKTPLPWINYLGCEDFFSLVSNTCGGYSFYKDAKLLRLTRYRYNNVPGDSNGHYYYIKKEIPSGIRAGCQPRLIWIPMNVITVSVIPFLKEAKMILPQS